MNNKRIWTIIIGIVTVLFLLILIEYFMVHKNLNQNKSGIERGGIKP